MKKNPSPRVEVMDCCETSRREFLRVAGTGLAVSGVAPMAGQAFAEKKKAATPETLVTQLYKSLNEKQQKAICFP